MTIVGSILGYLIIITSINKAFIEAIFKTHYLAIIYNIIYILALTIILKSLNIKDNIKFILVFLIFFIPFYGNFLVCFNSLYSEPMVIVKLPKESCVLRNPFIYLNLIQLSPPYLSSLIQFFAYLTCISGL